ncbi:hypothetical protein [Streptomyces sp. NPDC093094]|uniref:hypothetical protein n=1 Tax=Streptomyces sp. NPDC093094 TaxID=3366026 RepID=UPI003828ED0B
MSVEHDGYDGYDGHGAFGGIDGEGPDPLMAVIAGEQLPDEVRADAAFMAEHRSAEADVALLREHLGLIGHALGEPAPEAASASASVSASVSETAPEPVPVRVPVRRRRPFVLGVRAVGVACAVGVFSLLGWLVAGSGAGDGAADSGTASSAAADEKSGPGAAEDLSAPGYVACARLIAEGDVTAVDPVPGAARDRITLRVTRYLKPERGGRPEVTFVMDRDVDPRLREGDHALVSIPGGAASPDIWSVGTQDVASSRAWIGEALPESRDLACDRP